MSLPPIGALALSASSPVGPGSLLAGGAQAPAAPGGFGALLGEAVGRAEQAQRQLDHAIERVGTGQAIDVHEVTLAMAQADLSFRLALEVRNKLVEGVQDVLRMQV